MEKWVENFCIFKIFFLKKKLIFFYIFKLLKTLKNKYYSNIKKLNKEEKYETGGKEPEC
jgi:hypothetical protein